MSYLMKFERRPDKLRGRDKKPNPVFHVQWRSTTGQIEVNARGAPRSAIVCYKRDTRLGRLLSANHESEKFYLAKAIRDALGLHVGDRPEQWADITWHGE